MTLAKFEPIKRCIEPGCIRPVLLRGFSFCELHFSQHRARHRKLFAMTTAEAENQPPVSEDE